MDIITRKPITGKKVTFIIDKNPYDVSFYSPQKVLHDKQIIIPIFHYQEERQFIDLLEMLLHNGYKIVTVNLLRRGDNVLFFNYYYKIFEELLAKIAHRNYIEKNNNILVGFGVAANLASYMNFVDNTNFKFEKIILISPVNSYKGEYRISKEIDKFTIPTYIFYGQFDSANDIFNRYQIYKNGKDNKNVHFTCYAATGYFLYYQNLVSLDLEKMYRHGDYDLLVGEVRRNKIPLLPSEPLLNEEFFNHLFSVLEDKPLPKRIGLFIDACGLKMNGVYMELENLKKEYDALGYETYIVGLWEKDVDFTSLPSHQYIPIPARYHRLANGQRDLKISRRLNPSIIAKMLTMFDFEHIHIHTEYKIGQSALKLVEYTGIVPVYSYHNSWKIYYEEHYGKLVNDVSYKRGASLSFNPVFKEVNTVVVPSLKSYEILKKAASNKDIRIIPTGIDIDKFSVQKEDEKEIEKLREEYNLKDKQILGYVGRISAEKNITETILNLSKVKDKYPNLVLMIVGVGDAEESLRRYVTKLHIEDRVIFAGRVHSDELKYYYGLFDLFVTASNFETQGLTYLEAASCGCLILAKKDKSIDQIFKDKKNALLYDTFASWEEKLELALTTNQEEIKKNARLAVEDYQQKNWAKKILDIYQELSRN